VLGRRFAVRMREWAVTYAHSKTLLLIAPGIIALCVFMTLGLMTGETVHGGEPLRYGLLGLIWLLGAVFLGLFFHSGIARYVVTDDGLLIKHLFARSLHAWATITRLDWNHPLDYVAIRGESGAIAFTSTDFFPRLPELLSVIHERSGCEFSENVRALLGRDE
jgi:hypothetical protein